MTAGKQYVFDQMATPLFDSLRDMQDLRKIEGGHSWAPMLAAHHMRANMLTAAEANNRGLHAVALSLTRQAFEALMVIDAGLIATEAAWQTLERWSAGKVQAGALRKWLAENEWTTSELRGLWSEPWSEFVQNLSNALQPYAHFTPDLLQWNFNMVTPMDKNGHMIAAIGIGEIDEARAIRLQTLRGVLLWMLGQVMLSYPDVRSDKLGDGLSQLLSELKQSEWLISKSDWADNLIPHLYDRPNTAHSESA